MLTLVLLQVQREILPILQWHDEIVQSITQALEDFPNIIALVEKIQGRSSQECLLTPPHTLLLIIKPLQGWATLCTVQRLHRYHVPLLETQIVAPL